MKFVIEHLEPKLYEWCRIEYSHISDIVGKNNLIFTNVKGKKEQAKLKRLGTVYGNPLSELGFKRICVLSQYSAKTLVPGDGKRFECLVFGGILGDNPAKGRTGSIIKSLGSSKVKFETRSLGKKQMPTDTAVYVAKKVIEGRKLSSFKFADELEIEIGENESMLMKFRYVIDGNRPVISSRLVDYIREKGF